MNDEIPSFYYLKFICNSGVPLSGCRNHRLKLSILEILGKEKKRNKCGEITQQASGYQPLIRKIDLLMGELKTLKNASLLRSKTPLCPERKSVTRWGSILKMLLKWLSLRDPVNQITTWPDSVLKKIPTQSENS